MNPAASFKRGSTSRQAARTWMIAVSLLAGCGGGSNPAAGPAAGTVAATSASSASGVVTTTGRPQYAIFGGGGGAIPLPLPNANQAARFLNQATYGARLQDLALVTGPGIDAWIRAQEATPMTSQASQVLLAPNPELRQVRITVWWNTVVTAPDQLRQRVALALSEIFVVSDQSTAIAGHGSAMARYWDLLARDAFGNYRTLLEDVTLSPQMGAYLNMRGNQKPDAAANVHADENYAREVMQLFTIGLNQLNPDGTLVLDAQGHPVPTYTQADVSNLARALTGWSWNAPAFFNQPSNFTQPMIPFEGEHDTGAKTIVGGVAIPANGTAEADLKIALDTLFNHPNTGPFLAGQLIQRLVTSNPSPGYVRRVAAVFANNGQGVRGDLGAVVRAVLEDPEARSDLLAATPTFGKRREPLLVLSHLWRAFDGHDASGNLEFWNPETTVFEAPLSSASVFNFFRPNFSPVGAVQAAGMVAPEFQLVTSSNLARLHNTLAALIMNQTNPANAISPAQIMLHVTAWLPLATTADSSALVAAMNQVLMGGQMSAALQQTVVTAANAISSGDGGYNRVAEAIFLIFTSPEYHIQK